MVRPTRLLVISVAVFLFVAAGCRGTSTEGKSSPTAPARPTFSATASPAASPGTGTAPAPLPSTPVTSTPVRTPGVTATAAATSKAAATVPAGRVEELAPIERVDVVSGGGDTAVARITSGLPSGCAVYSRAAVTRQADVVRVEVYNHLPTGNVACTAIYGIVTNEVPLGAGFALGVPYTIEVNGTRHRFTLR